MTDKLEPFRQLLNKFSNVTFIEDRKDFYNKIEFSHRLFNIPKNNAEELIKIETEIISFGPSLNTSLTLNDNYGIYRDISPFNILEKSFLETLQNNNQKNFFISKQVLVLVEDMVKKWFIGSNLGNNKTIEVDQIYNLISTVFLNRSEYIIPTFNKYLLPLVKYYDYYGYGVSSIVGFVYQKTVGETGNISCENNSVVCFLATLFRDMIILEAINKKHQRKEPNIYISALIVIDLQDNFDTLHFLEKLNSEFKPLSVKMVFSSNNIYKIKKIEKNYFLGIFYLLQSISETKFYFNDISIDFPLILSTNKTLRVIEDKYLMMFKYHITLNDYENLGFSDISFLQGLQDFCNLLGFKTDVFIKKIFEIRDNSNKEEIPVIFSSNLKTNNVRTRLKQNFLSDKELDDILSPNKNPEIQTFRDKIIASKNTYSLITTEESFSKYDQKIIDTYLEKGDLEKILNRFLTKHENDNNIKYAEIFTKGKIKSVIFDKICTNKNLGGQTNLTTEQSKSIDAFISVITGFLGDSKNPNKSLTSLKDSKPSEFNKFLNFYQNQSSEIKNLLSKKITDTIPNDNKDFKNELLRILNDKSQQQPQQPQQLQQKQLQQKQPQQQAPPPPPPLPTSGLPDPSSEKKS